MKTTFKGYEGRWPVRVRNYIAVVPTVLCGISVARSIAETTRTDIFPHESGCGQVGLARGSKWEN